MNSAESTHLLALLGYPVAHSLSPFIMERAFAAAGMAARYVALPVPARDLGAAVDGLRVVRATGANVTYPYKEDVVALLDTVDAPARSIGAVNTIAADGNTLAGSNTDAPGTVIALERLAAIDCAGVAVAIAGAGGAARAAASGLLDAGAAAVTFAVRDPAAALGRLEAMRARYGDALRCAALADGDAFAAADIVINATPVGMGGGAASPVDAAWIRPGQVCVDFVYHPRRTAFLAAAAERGAKTLDGVAVLVAQASVSFERWTGRTFDVVEMTGAIDALGDERGGTA